MNTILFALIAVASALPVPSLDENALVLDDKRISDINSQHLGWVAARNPRFEGLTLRDVKRLLGVVIPENAPVCQHNTSIDVNDYPLNFDARKQWPTFVHAVRDQQSCGSCWAFSASEVLSDRLAIASNGSLNFVLSPQDLVSCDTTELGCGGGWPGNAADYIQSTGIPTDECDPYVSGSGGVPKCPASCKDGSAKTLYKYKSWKYVAGEAAMIAALQEGPIAVAFAVYQDFFSYKSGVYKADRGSGLAGYHAVKMVGYGEISTPDPVDCDPSSKGQYMCPHDTTCCCSHDTFFTKKCNRYSCCASTTTCGDEPGKKPSGCKSSFSSKNAPNSTTKYWIVQNSWGTKWGDNGYFLIERGVDSCGIENGPLDKGCPLSGVPLV